MTQLYLVLHTVALSSGYGQCVQWWHSAYLTLFFPAYTGQPLCSPCHGHNVLLREDQSSVHQYKTVPIHLMLCCYSGTASIWLSGWSHQRIHERPSSISPIYGFHLYACGEKNCQQKRTATIVNNVFTFEDKRSVSSNSNKYFFHFLWLIRDVEYNWGKGIQFVVL